MPHRQDSASLDRLTSEVAALAAFDLTRLHDLVTLSGSLILGLAVMKGRLKAAEAWVISRLDEDFQAEIWGGDSEADRASAIRREAFLQAARFVSLSGDKSMEP
jgi:chaperone required for assembly of F1-ATPase